MGKITTFSNKTDLGIANAAIAKEIFIKPAGTGPQTVAGCVAADIPSGVSVDAAAAKGDEIEYVRRGGWGAVVSAGAAIVKGAGLKPDANGQAITATVGTDHVSAIAIEAAAAKDDVIEIWVL